MISSSQRPVPDNTQHSQQTDVHAAGGIQTHDLSRRAAADLRLRPRGHWDWQHLFLMKHNSRQKKKHAQCKPRRSEKNLSATDSNTNSLGLNPAFRCGKAVTNGLLRSCNWAPKSHNAAPCVSQYLFRQDWRPESGLSGWRM